MNNKYDVLNTSKYNQVVKKIIHNIEQSRDSEKPTVNVYCVVYNHAPYLRKCLDGILMQKTDFSWNLVIHDDASTDGSTEIVREYVAKYPDRINAIIEEENIYQHGGSLLSVMKKHLDAKYRANCEGDDYWIDEYKLQKQVDFLETHPDYSVVYTNVLTINRDGYYDEGLRMGLEYVTRETKYSHAEIADVHIKTQTASLLGRNYYRYMTDDELDIYSSYKCAGDTKALMFYGYIGKVGILSDITAAYRRVLGDSDSWTSFYNQHTRMGKINIGYDLRESEYDFMRYYFDEGKYFSNWIIGYRIMTTYYNLRGEIKTEEDIRIKNKILKQDTIKPQDYIFFCIFAIRQVYRRIKWRIVAKINKKNLLVAAKRL